MPDAQNIPAQLFIKKQPRMIKNSPTKLFVPGKPIFAIVKIRKIIVNNGINIANILNFKVYLIDPRNNFDKKKFSPK